MIDIHCHIVFGVDDGPTTPDRKVIICHSISKGIYCEVKGYTPLTVEEVDMIKNRMKEIVNLKFLS